MSAWVLILFIHAGYAGGAVSIDMPSATTCQEARDRAIEQIGAGGFTSPTVNGVCLSRLYDVRQK